MKLVHRDQPVVELLNAEFVHGEAEGRVCADQNLVVAIEERAEGIDLPAIVGAGRIAEVPFWRNNPVSPEAVFGQWLVIEARADGFFRHHDDDLFDALIGELVERNEHERSALARSRGRFDEKILLAAPFIGALLHGPHA